MTHVKREGNVEADVISKFGVKVKELGKKDSTEYFLEMSGE